MFIQNQDKNKVERAISEIRRGLPIIIHDEDNYLLVSAAEIVEQNLFDQYKLILGDIYVTLTSSKIKYISQNEENRFLAEPVCDEKFLGEVKMSTTEYLDVFEEHRQALTTKLPSEIELCKRSNSSKRLLISSFAELHHLINCTQENHIKELQCSKLIDDYAVTLLKFSELLPYALVADMPFKDKHEMRNWCDENDIIMLHTSLINNFERNQSVYEVCKTSLFLKQTQKVNIISYRTESGEKEHYAIIIGNPNKDNEPLVRIHSSCYTGDLLDSLSCDCRSQLHQAIQMMTDSGSGIILYLMQDGRGIGLTNKLRAYNMQREHNLDTVDANRTLGFEDDERSFVVAAEMLKKLNIKKIQLLTNNNRKLSELESSGIEITKCIPLIVERNKYNNSYMETKFDKLGHKLRVS